MTVTTILGGLALAGACGLNPMVALLVTGVLERAGWIDLGHSWAAIGDTVWLAVFGLLYLSDFAIDRFAAGHGRRVHRGGVIVPPLVGALLFASDVGGGASWIVAIVLGGGTAAALHGVRAALRPARPVAADARRDRRGPVPGLHTTTMSLLEDAAAVLLVVVAFSLPAIAGAFVLALLVAAAPAALRARHVVAAA
ncbi:MAG: DUF4126 domain-containing protein [Solirubrobacteraceae bacterium]|nr:DUF4126 domain-containing protein [Patulibacter sp.]